MRTRQHWRIEAHGSGATLYVSGDLGAATFFAALDECDALAPSLRYLRVDLTGARWMSVEALGLFAARLGDWRRARHGTTWVRRAKALKADGERDINVGSQPEQRCSRNRFELSSASR